MYLEPPEQLPEHRNFWIFMPNCRTLASNWWGIEGYEGGTTARDVKEHRATVVHVTLYTGACAQKLSLYHHIAVPQTCTLLIANHGANCHWQFADDFLKTTSW